MKYCEISKDEYVINYDGDYYVVNDFTRSLLSYLQCEDKMSEDKFSQYRISKLNKYIKRINDKINNPEYYEKNIELKAPLKIQWKITNRCNLKCEHCYTAANEIGSKELEYSSLEKIALDIVGSGIMDVTISGGEALLVDKLEKIVTLLIKNQINVTIFTNGILIKYFIEKLPTNYNEHLSFSISIDGNEEVHDKIRGMGSFRQTIEGIKYALKQGYKIATNTVVMKKNVHCICNLIKQLNEIGVNQVQLSNLIVKGRARNEMKISSSEKDELRDNLKQILNDIEKTEILYAELPDEDVRSKVYRITESGNEFLGYEEWKCSAGIGKATIDNKGDLLCCPFIEKSNLGNLLDESIINLWKKNERLEFLKVLQKQNNNSRKCIVIREK